MYANGGGNGKARRIISTRPAGIVLQVQDKSDGMPYAIIPSILYFR